MFMLYICYHFLNWTVDFYRRVNHEFLLDWTSLIFNLLKEVKFLGSSEKLKTHQGNTFWTKWKPNTLKFVKGGILPRKYGNRRYFVKSTPVTATIFERNAGIRTFDKSYPALLVFFFFARVQLYQRKISDEISARKVMRTETDSG